MSLSKPPPRRFDPAKFELAKFGDERVLICRETFLPAYKDRAEFEKRSERFFPGYTVEKFWRCVWCGLHHVKGIFIKGSSGKHLANEKSLIDPKFEYPPPPKHFKPHVYKKPVNID